MRQPFPYNVKVSGKYGAPMGRAGSVGDPDFTGRLNVRPVPLYDGGYDGGGAYWGHNHGGEYLFCAFNADRSIIRFFRAKGERAALAEMREEYESAIINGEGPAARKIDPATGYDTRDASPEAQAAYVAAATQALKGL